MANQKFKRRDIVNETAKTVNEDNLNILCKQVEDMACYDKVGSIFYRITQTENGCEKGRHFDTVSKWLDHLETLKSTSSVVGYIGEKS